MAKGVGLPWQDPHQYMMTSFSRRHMPHMILSSMCVEAQVSINSLRFAVPTLDRLGTALDEGGACGPFRWWKGSLMHLPHDMQDPLLC